MFCSSSPPALHNRKTPKQSHLKGSGCCGLCRGHVHGLSPWPWPWVLLALWLQHLPCPHLSPWHIVGILALLAPCGLESALGASQSAPSCKTGAWQDWWGMRMLTTSINIRLFSQICRRKWQGIRSQRGCDSSSSTHSGMVGSILHPLRCLQARCRNHTHWSRRKFFPPWNLGAAWSKPSQLPTQNTTPLPSEENCGTTTAQAKSRSILKHELRLSYPAFEGTVSSSTCVKKKTGITASGKLLFWLLSLHDMGKTCMTQPIVEFPKVKMPYPSPKKATLLICWVQHSKTQNP